MRKKLGRNWSGPATHAGMLKSKCSDYECSQNACKDIRLMTLQYCNVHFNGKLLKSVELCVELILQTHCSLEFFFAGYLFEKDFHFINIYILILTLCGSEI